jgi:hypothetical protein
MCVTKHFRSQVIFLYFSKKYSQIGLLKKNYFSIRIANNYCWVELSAKPNNSIMSNYLDLILTMSHL